MKQHMKVVDPATGEQVGSVLDRQPEEFSEVVSRAEGALREWAASERGARTEILLRASVAMTQSVRELSRLIVKENGKTLREAKAEVEMAAEYFSYYGSLAAESLNYEIPDTRSGNTWRVTHSPVGVVAAITPFNFPLLMCARKVAPALAAGCPIILKPSPETPLSALATSRILQGAGLPDGVFSVVTTSHEDRFGKSVLADQRVQKLSFTGSLTVGQLLLTRSAANLTRTSLELGGNCPVIVCADADLDAAIDAVTTLKTRRVAGQSCVSANRIYVAERIYKDFSERLVARMAAITVGHGGDPNSDMGPLIHEDSSVRVRQLIARAENEGAQAVVGGAWNEPALVHRGSFCMPTVLLDCEDSMEVCRTEIFAPVAPVLRFREEEEVLRRANATSSGLAAYVFSEESDRIERFQRELQFGVVCANSAIPYLASTPFGGWRSSGLGREGGIEGLRGFLETKTLSTKGL